MEGYRKPVRPRGTDGARVIQVVETRALRGLGVEDDLLREVVQYWDFEGNFLAENDPCAKERCLAGFDESLLIH